MSTRGALVLVGNENVRTVYNHSDSYPDWLGNRTLGWLRAVLTHGVDGEGQARKAISLLEPVPDREPTEDDVARLAEFTENVSTGRDWYALLRGTQGDISAMLRAGLYEDAGDFPLDSLFCEWAYVADFDARVFEVYKGFQHEPPTAGRWVGTESMTRGGDMRDEYYPVQRVAVFGFDALPAELPDEDALESGAYATPAEITAAPTAIEG